MSKPYKKGTHPRVELDPDQLITDRILASLDQGIIPWRKPWGGGDFIPKNFFTGKEYTGSNIFLLLCANYEQPLFLTFNQAKDLGGNVKKGEHGLQLVRWLPKEVEVKDKAGKPVLDEQGNVKQRRFMYPKAFTVFNVAQCDGLTVPGVKDAAEFNPILVAEEVLLSYQNGPEIKHQAGFGAAYYPELDLIKMPPPSSFESPESYYATLFHEACHSTGAPSRLNRSMEGRFGSEAYAKEEFIAELGAAVLCARCGISNEQSEEQTIAYCQNWSQRLRKDPTLFRTLSSQGIEAARRIAGANQQPIETESATPEVELTQVAEVHPEEVGAPVFSIPSGLSIHSIARLLDTEPTFTAVQKRLQVPEALGRLQPEQSAAVLCGYEALRLKVALRDQADGLRPAGVTPVEFVPSRPISRGLLVEQAEVVLGSKLSQADLADLGGFFQANPEVRGVVEQRLGFEYVWRQGAAKGATPDALHCAAKRMLDLDGGNLTAHDVARIFGQESLSPEVLTAMRQNRPVLPRQAGEVYDLMVAAVGLEQTHEALVRAGYDSITSATRPLEAGRLWGAIQPAGLPEVVRRWTAFELEPGSGRKVLPLTEAAVSQGMTLSQLGVEPAIARQVVAGLAIKGIKVEVLEDPTSLLKTCPAGLQAKVANAEGICNVQAGLIQVIASNVEVRNGETPAAAVARVALHEAVVHYGVRKAVGDEAADLIFKRIRAQAAAGFDGNQLGVRQTPEQVAFHAVVNDPNYRKVGPVAQGEEILAKLQETEGYQEIGAWRRGIAAVRQAIANRFPDLNLKLSNNDVNYVLWEGRKAALGAADPAAGTVPPAPGHEPAKQAAATLAGPTSTATVEAHQRQAGAHRLAALAAIVSSTPLRRGHPGEQPNVCKPIVLPPPPSTHPSVATLCDYGTYFPNSRSQSYDL